MGEVRESVSVSAQSVALQADPAVQSNTTSAQLLAVPTSGHSWQTTTSMMAGVSQPDYIQSGGSNNPTRAMGITVNGQPTSNTIVRLDGVTQINQYFQGIQAYSPSIEAVETVSLVTSSFDAYQGMAGGASVNLQVKSGTNRLSGSLFDHATDYRRKAKNFFLPPDQPNPREPEARTSTEARSAVPSRKTSCSNFDSVERTRQRAYAGNPLSNIGANGLVSLPTLPMRAGDFTGAGLCSTTRSPEPRAARAASRSRLLT